MKAHPRAAMTLEGPTIEELVHHLAECPPDFLEPPHFEGQGRVHVAAVVSDLLVELGGELLSPEEAQGLSAGEKRPQRLNLLRIALVASWLLSHPWFKRHGPFASNARRLFLEGLRGLAVTVRAEMFVQDSERREELARLCLQTLGLRPKGESEEQAEDRLAAVDSVERKRVADEVQAAEERMRRVREAMARKAAEEAAAKVTRE